MASRQTQSPSTLQFSAYERRILLRLSKGGQVRRAASGHGKLGPLTVPSSTLERFQASELIKEDNGRAALTHIGAAYCERLKAGEADALGDGFQRQHQDRAREVREIEGKKRKVTVNRSESPLWWLRSRRGPSGEPLISDLQFAAGERLRQDWEMAQLGPRICMSWSDTPPDRSRRGAPTGPDLPPGALRAKDRVEAAMAHCGPGLSDVLVRVCCRQEGLVDAENALRWPRRSAKLILGFGLERLVDFYGLKSGLRPKK